MAKTADQHDADYEKDDLYYQGVPTLTDEQLEQVYQKAGICPKTGLATGKTINGDLIITVSPKLRKADNRATLRRLKDTAARCGCISCTGVLEGIRSAVKWYAQSPKVHKYARINRRHFIQSLRDVIASPVINHTGE
jgi:hypothetical protein